MSNLAPSDMPALVPNWLIFVDNMCIIIQLLAICLVCMLALLHQATYILYIVKQKPWHALSSSSSLPPIPLLHGCFGSGFGHWGERTQLWSKNGGKFSESWQWLTLSLSEFRTHDLLSHLRKKSYFYHILLLIDYLFIYLSESFTLLLLQSSTSTSQHNYVIMSACFSPTNSLPITTPTIRSNQSISWFLFYFSKNESINFFVRFNQLRKL